MKPKNLLQTALLAFSLPGILAAVTININVSNGDDVFVSADDLINSYYFIGSQNPYSSGALFAGLRYTGGGNILSTADFTRQNLQASPIVGALDGTVVSYWGNWSGDGGQTKSSLILRNGGHWIVESSAKLDFLQANSLFTRQLWVYGDGTGALELAEGFVADHSLGGTVADGLGSIRLSNANLVTHHTQSLPVGPRPDGSGGFQTNGHMVFENTGGSTWSTRTNPQTYSGAVWIGVDAAIDTQADLTHNGTTQFSSWYGSYWADNAFQTTSENVTVTKTGPADLILAEETAFLPGSVLSIQEGGVVFRTDPAAGMRKGSNNAQEGGPNLQVMAGGSGTDDRDARVRFEAPLSRIESLTSLQATVEILGEVQLDTFSSNSQDDLPDQFPPPPLVLYPGIVHFHLDAVAGQLKVSGDAALGGELLLTREDGFDPPVGTAFDLIIAGSFSAGPNGTTPRFESVEDRSGLGLEIEYLADRVRATTTRHARTTGMVIDEDWTDGAFDAPGWNIVDGQVAFRATGRADIPMALTRPVDVGFVWNAATIDVPGFFVGDDEVLVLKMTTFSDVAYNNQEWSKPEVACLHLNTHAQFGHDHATEMSRNYFTLGNWQQLKPSVENDDAIAFPGIHLAGGDNSTSLARNDISLVVFRPDGSNTNSEAWGMRNAQQATHNRRMQHWDNILISIPRGHSSSKAPVFRTGTTLETGLVGMSHAHVGITRRTDANMDYATDAYDFIYWNSYSGQGGTMLASGDFDNDGDTDSADLTAWEGNAGELHDPGFSESQSMVTLADLPGTGTAPDFIYDMATGELRLQTNGSAVSAWVAALPGPAVLEPALTGGTWWQAAVRGREQWVDTGLTGLSGNHLVATLAPDLLPSAFTEIDFGYAAGGAGFITVTVTGSPSADYADWAARHGLAGAAALPEAITNGMANLMRYGFGLGIHEDPPAVPDAEMVDDSGTMVLRLEYTRPVRGSDLLTTAQASDDLGSWSSAPAEVTLAITDNGDGSETVRAQVAVPDGVAAEKVFLRMRFELAGS